MLEFIVLPFLLIIGVAWFMNFADGGGKIDEQEELRKEKKKVIQETEDRYRNQREKNPLNVKLPPSIGNNIHELWLREETENFEFFMRFSREKFERVKDNGSVIKSLDMYKKICSRIKKEPDEFVIRICEEMK
jgi:hypothetical protein